MANGAIFQAANGYAPLTSGQRAAAGRRRHHHRAGRAHPGHVDEHVATTNRNGTHRPDAADHRAALASSRRPTRRWAAIDASQGRGQTGQSNSLIGEISVTVAEVCPNGTMRVRGEKLLRINRGNETIRISGIVRPGDIAADNRVPSTRVADAQIDYVGRGEIARASRQGWLQRFFSILSPF